MTPSLGFDLLLCALILAAAASAIFARDLFAAIIFFIFYGALASLAWVRLEAVDVALAEAAIGAGLTGLLLVGAAGRLRRPGTGGLEPPRRRYRAQLARAGQLTLCLAGAAALVALAASFPTEAPGLRPIVEQNLAAAAVDNPVTAVLLNFRSYDTLLEAVVLVLALVAVWSLTPDRLWGGVPALRQHARPDGVLSYFGRVLPSFGLLLGAYLFWVGADAPGGAFQAGTVLAAVWLLVAMAGVVEPPTVASRAARLLLVAGPGFFLFVGAAGALFGVFLLYPEQGTKSLILLIEGVLTASIAAALSLLVLGAPKRAPS